MNVDIDKMKQVVGFDNFAGSGFEKPFQVDGWLVATNGEAMIGVRSDQGDPFTGKGTIPARSLEILLTPLGDEVLPIDYLKQFAQMPVDSALLPPCEKCESTGQIDCEECDGSGYVDCQCHCGDEHTKDCSECDGEGGKPCDCGRSTDDTSAKFVAIEGVGFDAGLVGAYLFAVTAETFQFNKPTDKAWVIGGDDWRLAIMPLRLKLEEIQKIESYRLPSKGEAA